MWIRGGSNHSTINLCTDTEYILDNIQIWEVVAVSIVWNEETISSIKVYSLSLEQTTNELGNISYKQWL